jgi:hypothetical protein
MVVGKNTEIVFHVQHPAKMPETSVRKYFGI